MENLRRAYAVLIRAVQWLLIALTATLAAVVPVGVFFRYVLGSALAWTDELGGVLLAWITFLGSVVALHHRSHVGFDQILQLFPSGLQKGIRAAVDLAMAAFFLVLAVYGTQVSARLMNQMAVSMPLPTGLVYGVLPVSGVLMLIVLVARYTGIAADPARKSQAPAEAQARAAGHLGRDAEKVAEHGEEGAVNL